MSTSLDVPVSLRSITIRRWGLEVTGLNVENAAGSSEPYSVRLGQLRIELAGIKGWFTLIFGLRRFDGGRFMFGYRTTEIETLSIDGLELYLEPRSSEDPKGIYLEDLTA